MNLTKRIQRAVIRTSPYAPFRWAYWMVYGAMLFRLTMRLRRMPEIHLLELRAPRKGHRFGSSDLDVRAETSPLRGEEFFALSDRLADVLLPSKRLKRILDFYLFGSGEALLQRRLGSITFNDTRWIRLLGPKPGKNSSVKAVPAQAAQPIESTQLSRAIYEYGCLSQELFEAAPSPHSTWTLYRRMTRIDDHFASMRGTLDFEYQPLRDRIRSRANRLISGGALREVTPIESEELFAVALSEVDSISKTVIRRAEERSDRSFHLSQEAIRPANLPEVIGSCSAAITDLCARLAGRVESAILGCVPATWFDFRIYLIVRDGLDTRESIEVFRAIRKMYTAHDTYQMIPSTWLRLRHPMVLTRTMWRASSRWYHALRPVEEFFFFKRHGVVLWGRDPRDALRVAPSAADLIRSAAIAVTDLRNGIWEAHHSRRPRQLVDAMLGRIPALWLLLARSTIATSSEEALAGCAEAGFPQISILDELRKRLAGLRPQNLPSTEDALWKPALEASCDWLDDLVARALERLDSVSAVPIREAEHLSA
jgi:hypothetical protein